MERKLTAKRCLVTGGSRGLGRAICIALASRGAKVAFTYVRDDDSAESTKKALSDLGADVRVFKGTVSDRDHVQAVLRDVVGDWGGLDVLVNNAGINQMYPLALIEEDDWDRMMNVNVKGAYLFARAAAKQMIRQRRGHILNVGSFASERIIESPIHYAAAKSALRGLTEALALEVGRYDVQVNLIAPGVLDEGLSSTLPQHRLTEYLRQCAAGRTGRVSEIAESVAFLVSDANTFMTGAKLVFDGGL